MIGKDIVLRDNSVELSIAIRSMLQGSLDYAIAALKTMQAMVSESLDLIMYHVITSVRSHVLTNNVYSYEVFS